MAIAVLGGGVSGLSAAYYLKAMKISSQVIIFEGSGRLGGWVKSTRHEDGIIFEEGPRTLRVAGNAGANTLFLAEKLGLSSKIISVARGHPTTQNRMIMVGSKLYKLPNSLKTAVARAPPFSKPLVMSVLNDLKANRVLNNDESLYSFVNRRFGSEVASYVIDPLARGVFAGNARNLSVTALARRLHEVEQKHGSVLIGLFKDFKNSEKPDKDLSSCSLVKKAKKEKWAVWSLQGGLEILVEALKDSLIQERVEIRLNSPVLNITNVNGSYVLKTANEDINVKQIVSCLPAVALKNVVRDISPNLSFLLGSIPFVDVCVVTLQYSGNVLTQSAFGYLVPSTEPSKVLGVIFDTCTFPQGDRTILTVMMGGYWFKSNFGEFPSKETLYQIALNEVQQSLNINLPVFRHNVSILRNCIPQYVVGHMETVHNARKLIKDLKFPMLMLGNSFDGVGINDAIYNVKKAILS